eukprot:gene11221-7793_t
MLCCSLYDKRITSTIINMGRRGGERGIIWSKRLLCVGTAPHRRRPLGRVLDNNNNNNNNDDDDDDDNNKLLSRKRMDRSNFIHIF